MLKAVDTILSRLGIYDIIGVLLSGALITYITKIMIEVFWKAEEIEISLLNEAFPAFLICYFVGLIFQEFTSFIHKKWICHSKNRYLTNAITPSSQHYLFLEDEEIDAVNKHVSDKLGIGNLKRKDNIIYNYCKNYYRENANTVGADRDQAIAAMARSLSFYCFFAVLIPLIKIICLFSTSSAKCCNTILLILLLLGFVLLGMLLYHRFTRFTYRRFITIYRYYLYNVVWNKKVVKYAKKIHTNNGKTKRH